MDCKDFITQIKKGGLRKKNNKTILKEIFSASGAKEEVSESAASSWLQGKRNCKSSYYFPDGQIDKDGLISYIKKNLTIQHSWKNIQDAFYELSDSGYIDLDTDNENKFWHSLVNQFIVIFNLPPIKLTINYSAQMCNIFNNEFNDCRIKTFLSLEPNPTIYEEYNEYVQRFISNIKRDLIDAYSDTILDEYSLYKKQDIITYLNTLEAYTYDFMHCDLLVKAEKNHKDLIKALPKNNVDIALESKFGSDCLSYYELHREFVDSFYATFEIEKPKPQMEKLDHKKSLDLNHQKLERLYKIIMEN